MSNKESVHNNKEERVYTDEEKHRAAYALNMCTVSISQIIDYDDLNILEQEYDTILNNLDLEKIPKDEALLRILRQLLDTITYFKIQEGDRKFIEREYQEKMRNALWAAVPNFGVFVAGTDPYTMAFSLASQVGVGYMNYRRNKNEYLLQREKEEWKLQRAAMEQFNALRRELFDTAWRLADTYGFQDEYRLTERQINQYNKILMDTDDIRKYERLDSIKEKFAAYPPFWYFFGNAANYIAENKSLDISEELRLDYRKKAVEHFEKYRGFEHIRVLREDAIAASCLLEHVDILLGTGNYEPYRDKILDMIREAIRVSGGSNEVLELCAIAYLRIREDAEAGKILRILVNEDYNKVLNGQLLSGLYARIRDCKGYEVLLQRVDPQYLYPMPTGDQFESDAEADFLNRQRLLLKKKYQRVLADLVRKYSVRWNKLTSVFDEERIYPEKFFWDTAQSEVQRCITVSRLFEERRGKGRRYTERMRQVELYLGMLDNLNDLFRAALDIDECLRESSQIDQVVHQVEENLDSVSGVIDDAQEAMHNGGFDQKAYISLQRVNFSAIVKPAIIKMYRRIAKGIDGDDMAVITVREAKLNRFCKEQELELPEIAVDPGCAVAVVLRREHELFASELFGDSAVLAQKRRRAEKKLIDDMRKEMNENVVQPNGQKFVFYKGDEPFRRYLDKHTKVEPLVARHTYMIIDSGEKALFFTGAGILIDGQRTKCTKYHEVKLTRGKNGDDGIVLHEITFGELSYKSTYRDKFLDMGALYRFIQGLSDCFGEQDG